MKRFSNLVLGGLFVAAVTVLPAASTLAASATLSATDSGEIATGYQHLTTDFYKKVDEQAILNSIRAQLLFALKSAGVAHASITPMKTSDVAGANVRTIDHAIVEAAAESRGKLSDHQTAYVALDGMMRSVNDRYTVFLNPKDYAGLNEDLDGGDFGGTGIVIQVDEQTKYIVVENIVPDGPADKAGVQQDDLITAIDGTSTKGMTVQQASAKLRGKEGTSVSLTLNREGAAQSPIAITRAKIH